MKRLVRALRALFRPGRAEGGIIIRPGETCAVPVILSPAMTVEEAVEYYGEDFGLRLNPRAIVGSDDE